MSLVLTLKIFHTFFSVSIVDIEQVMICWAVHFIITLSKYWLVVLLKFTSRFWNKLIFSRTRPVTIVDIILIWLFFQDFVHSQMTTLAPLNNIKRVSPLVQCKGILTPPKSTEKDFLWQDVKKFRMLTNWNWSGGNYLFKVRSRDTRTKSIYDVRSS